MEKLQDARMCPHCSKLCCAACIQEELVELVSSEHKKIDKMTTAENKDEEKEELSDARDEGTQNGDDSSDSQVADEKQAKCVETTTL